MEQFNLDTWLQNKSRRVVTRDGRTVEILKWTRKDRVHPIIFTVIDSNGTEQAHYCNADGICMTRTRPNDLDLFFSDDDDLTDFESKLYSMISDVWQDYMLGNEVNLVQVVKENSTDILKSAKDEFLDGLQECQKCQLDRENNIGCNKCQLDCKNPIFYLDFTNLFKS